MHHSKTSGLAFATIRFGLWLRFKGVLNPWGGGGGGGAVIWRALSPRPNHPTTQNQKNILSGNRKFGIEIQKSEAHFRRTKLFSAPIPTPIGQATHTPSKTPLRSAQVADIVYGSLNLGSPPEAPNVIGTALSAMVLHTRKKNTLILIVAATNSNQDTVSKDQISHHTSIIREQETSTWPTRSLQPQPPAAPATQVSSKRRHPQARRPA